MREVLPFALAAAVGLIYFRLAIIMMSYLATDHETGIYSAAQRIVETVGVIPWLVVSAGFPILARAARDDADRLKLRAAAAVRRVGAARRRRGRRGRGGRAVRDRVVAGVGLRASRSASCRS